MALAAMVDAAAPRRISERERNRRRSSLATSPSRSTATGPTVRGLEGGDSIEVAMPVGRGGAAAAALGEETEGAAAMGEGESSGERKRD